MLRLIAMDATDARSLSADAQEDLRRRVVRAVKRGMSKAEAVRTFGVSKTAVFGWIKAVRRGGERSLASRPRGRPKQSRLKPYQAATTVRIVADRCPDQLKLPFALWTREAVAQLIERRWDLRLSVWTVGRYLKKVGLHAAEALATGVRAQSSSRPSLARRRVPGHRPKGQNPGSGDSLGRRDGTSQRPSDGNDLRPQGTHAGHSRYRPTIPL